MRSFSAVKIRVPDVTAVGGAAARPAQAQRTRTGANNLWVLTVLEMWLQQHRVG